MGEDQLCLEFLGSIKGSNLVCPRQSPPHSCICLSLHNGIRVSPVPPDSGHPNTCPLLAPSSPSLSPRQPSCPNSVIILPSLPHSIKFSVIVPAHNSLGLCSVLRDIKVRPQRLSDQLPPKLEMAGTERRASIRSQMYGRAIYQAACYSCCLIGPASLPGPRTIRVVLQCVLHRMADLIKSPTPIMLGRGVEFQ